MAKIKERCGWAAKSDAQMQQYHDEEWGVPEKDGRALWELLMLEGFQAGLSWQIILRKREGFRRAFAGFDPRKVARFTEVDIDRLMQDENIVRARAKIVATIAGAKIYLDMQKSGEDFAKYLWSFTKGKVVRNSDPTVVKSDLSETISKDLRKRGFKFVGPVIVYAFLQAAGIVDDHHPSCFRHKAR
jgi:DNA-3-methyladenine glycosylase I